MSHPAGKALKHKCCLCNSPKVTWDGQQGKSNRKSLAVKDNFECFNSVKIQLCFCRKVSGFPIEESKNTPLLLKWVKCCLFSPIDRQIYFSPVDRQTYFSLYNTILPCFLLYKSEESETWWSAACLWHWPLLSPQAGWRGRQELDNLPYASLWFLSPFLWRHGRDARRLSYVIKIHTEK